MYITRHQGSHCLHHQQHITIIIVIINIPTINITTITLVIVIIILICTTTFTNPRQGYAANGIKHCIRPTDMKGKSAAVILRQIHPAIYAEAQKLLQEQEMVQWVGGSRDWTTRCR